MEIKLCPHCGGWAHSYIARYDEVTLYGVICESCRVRTQEYYDVNDAIKVWNRRTKDER